MTTGINRRRFLRTTLAAGAGLWAARGLAAEAAEAAEIGAGKRVGLIGTGWYGKYDLLRLLQVAPVNVVSLCDVDRTLLEEAGDIVADRQASGKVPRLYRDYRTMLAEKDLDLVLIATPDHWHALPALAAMEAGADLYLQKPVSVDVREGRMILDTARRLGRVVQVGTQRRSTEHLIEAKERYVDGGMLGAVGHIELCSYYHMRVRNAPPNEDPPAGLDWDMWCGPAPRLPFNKRIHPRGWRSFREFGNGIVGDMCIHMLDTARWMLGLGWPDTIFSRGGAFVDPGSIATVPDTQTAVFGFDGLNAVWTHRTWGNPADKDFPWSAIIYGENGTLKLSVHRYEWIPRKGGSVRREVTMELDQFPADQDEQGLEKHVAPAIRGHMRDWLQCVESRGKPVADISEGYASSASCILANVSNDLGRSIRFDPGATRIIGDDDANTHLQRPYRAPWKHPAAS